MVGVGGSYQLNDHSHPLGGEGEGWQAMAFLRWELFDGARTRHEKIKAVRQAAEAEEYLKGMKKMVSFRTARIEHPGCGDLRSRCQTED